MCLKLAQFCRLCCNPAESCSPYSMQACKDAAMALKLQLGSTAYPFSGPYHIKGCYAYSSGQYAGQVYYSPGGKIEDMRGTTLPSEVYRPKNYDCALGNHNAYVCVRVYT